ncbi:endonuclease [Dactylococcopsis salina]|uniref:endonuclease n=1 Tax=Dactylococcopsis salina TaxID=292566 RepID=UPI0002ECF63D|nr:endonuclease [Dactylococcopsis salina]
MYSYRFRKPLPREILNTQSLGWEWIIESVGKGKYRFVLDTVNRIIPNNALIYIKVPEATPEIITRYSLGDEQSLLTKIRYNRLIDIFLGITAYSLQNHLRTTVTGIGQVEIDEIYVGLNSNGSHFVVPVQAKIGKDQLSVIQTRQDIAYCDEVFGDLICRSVSAQFLSNDLIVLFELTLEEGQIKVVQEKHYKIVSSEEISVEDVKNYRYRESS